MKKIGLLLLITCQAWAQTNEPSALFIRYFSGPNQQLEIKHDTLWVYWYEAADKQNPLEFRDTSAVDLRQIADVKIIKGRNLEGKKGIGIQIYPKMNPVEKRYSHTIEIDAQKLSQTNTASVTQKLQGQAAGVTIGNDNSPGGGTMVRIRGIGSINANSPLYVVDGVPLQGNINSINPNDIASVQVLKDPSQTALYGVRGANGVIVINTNKGQEQKWDFTQSTVLPLTLWSWGSMSAEMQKTKAAKRIISWLKGK
ncbi:MAG: TonB-dependent receptor plug domain-containing protein [Cytophagaceae bacterium]|nr:TonB-dependent receptor plug domain-containing protein [Cytophagaceae bacterium]MBP6093468.1 TonB-dependent receptor plug domain-containing protein [Cytophagaceae bacterium]